MSSYNDNASKQIRQYDTIQDIVTDMSNILLPPERISVNEAAAKYRVVYNPPAYVGKWDNDLAPYLNEPMSCLESRDYSAVCLVSAAQSLKTELMLNWLAYAVKCDPSDMMIVEKSRDEAKNFSLMKIDRMIRHSPEIKNRMIRRRTADNTFDKRFNSGTILTITWPTVNTLSGKTIRRIGLTDYDRMDQNVGDEGSPFDLARRRTNTYKRLGMTYVESSPSFDSINPRWRPSTPHEAPPTEGILGIYNRGDRRRRYWQCPHCKNWFEPSFQHLRWPDSDDPMECAEQVFMACPHCFDSHGAIITQSMRPELDQHGVWLRDNEKIDQDGKRYGKPRRSDIASFWVKGPNTALGQWRTLVINYLLAMQEFESTDNDRPLKTTVNTDQGEVYIPPHVSEVRAPEDLMARAKDIGDKVIPKHVRFQIACVDVQKHKFIVQVHGIVPAPEKFDITLIDRFEIRKSARLDEDGDPYPIDPGAYPEDWDQLTKKVLDKTYPTDEVESRQMAIRLVLCDSGGRAGVTANAYDYYRKLKREGLASRFMLVKGDPLKNAPRVRKSFPDSDRKDRKAGARGEIPVLMLQTDLLKDWLDRCLERKTPGGGYIEFPDHFDLDFYKELCAEVKNPKTGKWENPKKVRNETTDLLAYCLAGCVYLRVEKMDWEKPFVWADEWDNNPLVNSIDSDSPIKNKKDSFSELEKLANTLG